MLHVRARPYAFPFEAIAQPVRPALLALGMQGAQVQEIGAPAKAAKQQVARLCHAFRDAGAPVFLGRRGVQALADLPPVVAARNQMRDRDRILNLDDPLSALAVEAPGTVFTHRADNAFLASDLGHLIAVGGINALVICGFRIESTVHATMREANDRGLECLLVEDACATDVDGAHETIVSVTTFGNGLFGTVATTDDVLDGFNARDASAPARATGESEA